MDRIELQHLTIGYREKAGEKVVLSDLNAAINAGELTCLIGPNGVGKSTLLRTLSAFQPPLSGRVVMALDGREPVDLQSLKSAERSQLIGVVLTERPDVQNMTVRELVSLGRSPYTDFWGRCTESDYAVVDGALSQVGIGHLSRRNVSTLSDGERQKVMIAKALAQETPVVFLDEPTAFLDFPSKVEVMKLLRSISRTTGKTIFLSTHDVEMALQLADTLWLLGSGRGISIGSPRQLAADGTLSAYFDGPGIVFDADHVRLTVKP